MQIILKSISMGLIMILLNLFLPWWGFILIAISASWWVKDKVKDTILISVIASTLSWLPLLVYSYLNGGQILFTRVSQMMGFSNTLLLFFSTGILVSFLGGLAGISGFYIKELFNDKSN